MKHDTYVHYATDCLEAQIRRLKKELRAVRSAASAEPIHQSRVTARRLGGALRFFSDLFSRSELNQGKQSMRALSRELGRARDLDVQQEILQSWGTGQGKKKTGSCDAVAVRVSEDRQGLNAALYGAVREFARARTLGRIKESLRNAGTRGAHGKKHMRRRAKKSIARCLSAITRHSRPADKTELLHRLRSRLRTLRYTLEICRYLKPEQLEENIERIHAFQDILGRMHDVDVLRERIATHQHTERCVSGSRRYLLQRCTREHRRLYLEFQHAWQKCRRQGFWHQVREIVAE